MPRSLKTIFLGAAMTSVLLLATTPVANAAPFPELRMADNYAHAWCFGETLPKDQQDVIFYASDRIDAIPIMDTYGQTCRSGTDVYFYDKDLDGLRGGYICTTVGPNGPNGRCAYGAIYIDFAYLDSDPPASRVWHNRRKTAVHEFGHSIGFDHHSPGYHDCPMLQGRVPDDHYKWRYFPVHDADHVNAAY